MEEQFSTYLKIAGREALGWLLTQAPERLLASVKGAAFWAMEQLRAGAAAVVSYFKAAVLEASGWLLSNAPAHPLTELVSSAVEQLRSGAANGFILLHNAVVEASGWLLSNTPAHPLAELVSAASWAVGQLRSGATSTLESILQHGLSPVLGGMMAKTVFLLQYTFAVTRDTHHAFAYWVLRVQVDVVGNDSEIIALGIVYLVYYVVGYQVLRLIQKVLALGGNVLQVAILVLLLASVLLLPLLLLLEDLFGLLPPYFQA
ncbi:hypothetical protein XANCAGTX0491_004926 [Xanthoria calcicola]